MRRKIFRQKNANKKTAKIEKCEGGVDAFGRMCVCLQSSLTIICGKVEIECRLKWRNILNFSLIRGNPENINAGPAIKLQHYQETHFIHAHQIWSACVYVCVYEETSMTHLQSYEVPLTNIVKSKSRYQQRLSEFSLPPLSLIPCSYCFSLVFLAVQVLTNCVDLKSLITTDNVEPEWRWVGEGRRNELHTQTHTRTLKTFKGY